MNINEFLRHLNFGFSEAEYDEIENGTILLKSGHKINWNQKGPQERAWEVDPATCDHEMKWIQDDDGKDYPYNTDCSYWECEICGEQDNDREGPDPYPDYP